MKVKMILPSLAEAGSPLWRPIKYSLFPPLGLATLAGYLSEHDDIEIIDQHVESLSLDDRPDLVIIQVYITNAYRAYSIADHYRSKGCYVALGGLHVTAKPEEAIQHADSIFTGPGDDTFPMFLNDFRRKQSKRKYSSTFRSLIDRPKIRRDLIKRQRYLVPNSIVVSRGCPFKCNFCYKESFFKGGKSFYTARVDDALREIDSLPGRHLYFLDDHLLADKKFAEALFNGMKGMNKVFQAAATVNSITDKSLIEKAVGAGLRSVFIGFETLALGNLAQSNKNQNIQHQYTKIVTKLQDLGVMINGSFVFGFDEDTDDVFKRTVDWGVKNSITTATFHILTPYPGTQLFNNMLKANRITTKNWDFYDTRHVVYKPKLITPEKLTEGYWWAYNEFYSISNILKSANKIDDFNYKLKQLTYTIAWKKLEPLWKIVINAGLLNKMTPVLEEILKIKNSIDNSIKTLPIQQLNKNISA